MQSKSKKSNAKFLAVRFGNVVGSSGSVIPLFEKQIKVGGPLTVTHPKMKRFFMTIPEAVQLVLQTPILGKTGDILVLDMGEQYNLLELAKDMIMLNGFVPQKDIQVKISGIRKGEKMEEELFGKKEILEKTQNPRISIIKTNLVAENKLQNFLCNILNIEKFGDKEDIKEILIKEFNKLNTS
ncbi:Polysaccharide biosynthesis protein [uncultured archaeon]|nr:Polysaccharide biosynthesis protein [uncultured archaeon]